MYNCNKKDNYHKKIEELIERRNKRSRKDSSSSKTSNNDDIFINFDSSSNDNTNDDNTSNSTFEGINTISSNIDKIDSTSKIRVQKWIPGGKVEGIRKYLGIYKISHN